MNVQILIQAVIQQTTVFVAQLATAGGLRAPLTRVANQVFLDLSNELQQQGVTTNVIADMFGLTLRTYHRKVHELSQSQSVEGRSIWEAVLEYVRQKEPICAAEVQQRFASDDRDVVASVLNDLVNTGLFYRSGRGSQAVYRVALDTDFQASQARSRDVANEYLVWQTVYRNGPALLTELVAITRLAESSVELALATLTADGRVERDADDRYSSQRLEVPVGFAHGWEAAIFDHFQALVGAVCAKLSTGEDRSDERDHTGGATFHLDLWPGHPLEAEALGTLARLRSQMEDLRARIDAVSAERSIKPSERLIVYVGQHFKSDRAREQDI
jgi:hypothetical protein